MRTVTVLPGANPQTHSWHRAEAVAVNVTGIMNRAVAELVDAVAVLIEESGWCGISSPDAWVAWHANMATHRARGIVRIARRVHELPICLAEFRAGRITEDAMVRIAKRVPTVEDETAAKWGRLLTIPQLTKVLSVFPELKDPDPNKPEPYGDPERSIRRYTRPDGWVRGSFQLPPDEAARLDLALAAARDAEYRDRKDLDPTDEIPVGAARLVSDEDAFARMCDAALDGLDPALARTGRRGDRFQVVLHHDVQPDGGVGPGRLHLGCHVPDALARYLACDAEIIQVYAKDGKLLGIHPDERTPNRKLRRALEHRDGGCAHPLCEARRWLHAHHIQHWEDGGPTIPSNLISLCPAHHRALHRGEFTITGDPEAGTVEFRDKWKRLIAPPDQGDAPPPPQQPEPNLYEHPLGEPLRTRDWIWN